MTGPVRNASIVDGVNFAEVEREFVRARVYPDFTWRAYDTFSPLNPLRVPLHAARVAFVEFRGEDPAVLIKPVHKMTEAQVRKEMLAQPLQWVETLEVLPQQHIIVFRKKQ